jgi:hypothetical protein
MPSRLDNDALLRVSDQGGRIVRHETLPAGTDLRERLRLAHENYQRQGWEVGELRSGPMGLRRRKSRPAAPGSDTRGSLHDTAAPAANDPVRHGTLRALSCPRWKHGGPIIVNDNFRKGCASLVLVSCFASNFAKAEQFICTAGMPYSTETDGRLTPILTNRELLGAGKVFTVDTSTGVVQGDQLPLLGAYRVAYAGSSLDGAKLLRKEGTHVQVLFVETFGKNPYPFLYTDGVTLLTGTCRQSA